jgi:hypothetical protein
LPFRNNDKLFFSVLGVYAVTAAGAGASTAAGTGSAGFGSSFGGGIGLGGRWI